MKQMNRLFALLLALILMVSVCGIASGDWFYDDTTGQWLHYYIRMPMTLKPASTSVKVGDTVKVDYEISKKTEDGKTWDTVGGGYEWSYVNEYPNEDGTTDTWTHYLTGGDITDFTGTLSIKAERSDFTILRLTIYAYPTDEFGNQVYIEAQNETDPDCYETDRMTLDIKITDAKKRNNVTCDFSLPETTLAYGDSMTVGYAVKGLDQKENVIVSLSVYGYEKATHTETSSSKYIEGEFGLSGEVSLIAEDANYLSAHLGVSWEEGSESFYKDFESQRISIPPLSLGASGWITKDGKSYYGDSEGNAYRGRKSIEYKSYYFDREGALVTGWFSYNGGTAYADENGVMLYGYDTFWQDSQGGGGIDSTHIKEINGEVYWFDNYTIRKDQKVNDFGNGLYYLDKDGHAMSGWFQDGAGLWYYGKENKQLATGWTEIDGKSYYFEPEGIWDIDYLNYSWSYKSSGREGAMSVGKRMIDGTIYLFDENGVLTEGTDQLIQIASVSDAAGKYTGGGITLELKEDGSVTFSDHNNTQTGQCTWALQNGIITYYLLLSDGTAWPSIYFKMASDHSLLPFEDLNATSSALFYGLTYLSKEMAESGWTETAEGWKYFENGQAVTGWKQIQDSWYYFSDSAVMVSGWLLSGDRWYYFTPGGSMATGWQDLNNSWYYFTPSGDMVSGWQNIGGVWYYFDAGAMTTGWKEISGSWYYFTSGGAMTTGWQDIGGSWYYFAPGGDMATGWKEIGGAWYFFDGGVMTTGWKEVDQVWYYFSDGGAMLTGWQVIGGQWELFSDSGVWQYTWSGN